MSRSSSACSRAGIDALDPAGELVIDALQDAGRVSDHARCRQAPRRSVAERPSRISCETRLAAVRASWSVAASVMPVPSRLEASCPVCSASRRIWWPAPWTSATPMRRLRSRAMSSSRLRKFSSSTTAPSSAMTNTFVAKARDVAQDLAQVGQCHVEPFSCLTERGKMTVYSFKQLAHRLVEVNALDGVGQQRGHAQHVHVRQMLLRRQRDAVGDDDLLERRIAQPLDGLAAQDARAWRRRRPRGPRARGRRWRRRPRCRPSRSCRRR